jgi:hypothetical protein
MPQSSHKFQQPTRTSPAVQNYLSACSALIEHMRKGGALTEVDLDLVKQVTTSIELLLPAWETQNWPSR